MLHIPGFGARTGLLCVALCISALARPDGTQNAETALSQLCDSLVARVQAQSGLRRIAVVPFSDQTSQQTANRGIAVSEFVQSRLASARTLQLVDRAEFQKMLDEIELSMSDLAESDGALTAGRFLAADAICTGSISELFGKVRVTAKVLKTETSEVIATFSQTVAPASLDGLARELLGESGKVSSTLFRSLLVPGWGQLYTDHYARGISALAICAVAAGFCAYTVAVTVNTQNEYDAYYQYYHFSQDAEDDIQAEALRTGRTSGEIWAEYGAKLDDYYQVYQDNHDRAVIAGVITGSAWALNLIDAAIAGAQSRRKFQLYFSAIPGQGAGVRAVALIPSRR